MIIEYLRGTNVVAIKPARDEMRIAALSQVEAYWDGLRDGRVMPARSELDPRGIAGALDYAFVLEVIAPGIARIRLAGHHLTDLMGMEVRGMPLTALFLPEARPAIQKALSLVADRPASLRLRLGTESGLSRPPLSAGMYLAPLKDDKGRPTRIFGALQSDGRIGRAPRRFNVQDMQVNALRVDEPTGEGAAPAGHDRVPGFGGHSAGFAPALPADTPGAARANPTAAPGAVPHLKLVVDRSEG